MPEPPTILRHGTTMQRVIELLAAPLNPGWDIQDLAEHLLGTIAAQSENEFVLEGTTINDSQAQRLIRPLLACLATMSAAEAGTSGNIYGGHLSFNRQGPQGPVRILVQFENHLGNVRAAFQRSSLPQVSTATMQKPPATPVTSEFDAVADRSVACEMAK